MGSGKGKPKDAETKAAVIAALLAGETAATVATRYGVDKATVSRWKAQLPATELQQVATAKRQTLAELIETAFTTFVTAEMKIAEDFQDETWRKSLSLTEQLTIAEYCAKRSKGILETAHKIFIQPKESDESPDLLELPAADLATELDIQPETPATDSTSS